MRDTLRRARESLGGDVREIAPIGRAAKLGPLQFLLVLPTLLVVVLVALSAAFGLDHPGANFGAVFTWVVWWGALLLSLFLFGRAWCLVCPVGAIGEWLQRLSFWWRSRSVAGLGRPWPRRLRSAWLGIALFVVFVFLDSGYGMSSSPRMTAGLIAVLVLAAAWVGLVFERRAFCRYVCPLTAFIGLGALSSMFELRRRNGATCAACATKDCFRGSESHWGCPMGEYPGGGMDSNLHCILCMECVKACRADNIALRFRAPGRDLWAMARPRPDGAAGAVVIVGLTTVVPLLLVTALPGLRGLFGHLLPAGVPPNDPPRLAAAAALFAAGLGATIGLVHGASAIGRWAAGPAATGSRALGTRYLYALIPIGLARLVADLLDHVLRTWGAVSTVTRALLLDFPLNRVVPASHAVVQRLGPLEVYALQVVLLVGGLLWSLFAMRRTALRGATAADTALATFIPMVGLALLLTLVGLWTLGIALL